MSSSRCFATFSTQQGSSKSLSALKSLLSRKPSDGKVIPKSSAASVKNTTATPPGVPSTGRQGTQINGRQPQQLPPRSRHGHQPPVSGRHAHVSQKQPIQARHTQAGAQKASPETTSPPSRSVSWPGRQAHQFDHRSGAGQSREDLGVRNSSRNQRRAGIRREPTPILRPNGAGSSAEKISKMFQQQQLRNQFQANSRIPKAHTRDGIPNRGNQSGLNFARSANRFEDIDNFVKKIDKRAAQAAAARSYQTPHQRRQQQQMSRDRLASRRVKTARRIRKKKVVLCEGKMHTTRAVSEMLGLPMRRIQRSLRDLGENVSKDVGEESISSEAVQLIAHELGATFEIDLSAADVPFQIPDDADAIESDGVQHDWPMRPPIISVVGHVDHGKTTVRI